jgi:aminomethyltransferase
MTGAPLQRTPFYAHHVAAGGKLVPFAGWEMPVQFSTVMAEHKAVRERAGVFDISHMGQVWVAGPAARAFLQKLVTNDVGALPPGRGVYALLCKPDGGVIDDLYIYCLETDRFLVIVNASRAAVDIKWMKENLSGDAMLIDQPQAAALALQGPSAAKIMGHFSADALALPKNGVAELTIEGNELVVARTGYTGEDGFEIFSPAGHLLQFYPSLLKRGSDYGLIPCGLGARDTLRLEMGYRLYGNDLDEHHSALEAGLGWAVKFGKGDFIGRDSLYNEKTKGSHRKFIGLRLADRGVPRHGCPIVLDGKGVGEVTSGTFSPSLNIGIAVGYVEAERFPASTARAAVRVHERDIPADVVVPPFYKKS